MKVSSDSSSFLGGDDHWPPGFRFHPTDEELLLYYLKRKICRLRLKIDAIAEVDVYKADPEDLPQLSKLKTGDRQWFFFSPRDKKYPHGGRSNRATGLGYWKATGKDRHVTCNSRLVGIKKTLVFYRGRAPSGERTDWVMHEYTLDEEELKRCPAQDYYALYKIYKKSGPGPKNGEQYGAPFREEDWADDEKTIDTVDEQVTPAQLFSQQAASLNNTGTNCQVQSQINGLDEFLNRMVSDPLFEPLPEPCGSVKVAGGDEDTQTTLVNPLLVERSVQERAVVFPLCGQLNGVEPCLNKTQSASSQFQETSEVTYATNMIRQGSHVYEEDFVKDFLEIDDLIGPEPTQQNVKNPVDDLRIEDFDGLCELDLFQDVSMFLQDADDTEPASCTYNNSDMKQVCNPIHLSCPNNSDDGIMDEVSNSYFNGYQTEMVQPTSQPFYNDLGNEMVNQFTYQMPHDPDVADQVWLHKLNFSMPTPAAPNQGSVIPPTSGVVYSRESQNQFHNHNQIQNQNGKVNEGEESWLSSTLWSFVETIPTTPAFAAESTVLVNKAFERLSSFGRRGDSVKVRFLNTNVKAGDPTATYRRFRNRYNRGFMIFSLLGVLSAILWVFTGASMKLLGRCLS